MPTTPARTTSASTAAGLKGTDLSTHVRILAAADVFDALSAERPYRAALPIDQVLSMLRAEKGRHLCPICVNAVCAIAPETLAAGA